MGTQARTSNTTSINQLNIALMLISCVVAMFVPFQLFLFSYAFLGPAHYLTEISWLHKRHFFTKRAARLVAAEWLGRHRRRGVAGCGIRLQGLTRPHKIQHGHYRICLRQRPDLDAGGKKRGIEFWGSRW